MNEAVPTVLRAEGDPLRVVSVGARWEERLALRARDLVGREFHTLVHPADRNLLDAAWVAVQYGAVRQVPVRLVATDGSTWGGSARIARGSGGITVEVSEHEAGTLDDEVHETLHRFRSLVERALDAFFIKDVEGRYLYINPAGAGMLGGRVEDVLGKRDSEYFAPEAVRELRDIDVRVMETGQPWTYQPTREIRGGSQQFFTRKYPYHDRSGRLAGVMGVSHDVTEWALAEQQRHRSDAALRRILLRSPDLIVVCRASRVLFANPAARSLLCVEGGAELEAEPVERWLPAGGFESLVNDRFVECAFTTMGGDAVPVEANCLDVDWTDGPATLILARDLRTRQQLEAELRRSDRLAVVGTFVAGLAHEINSPLGYARLQLDGLAADLRSLAGADETIRARVVDAIDGVERVAGLVRDLRRYVQGEGGEPGEAELCAVLQRAVAISAAEWRFRTTLRLSTVPPIRVRGREASLVQVFVNLIVNAARNFPEGGGPRGALELSIRSDARSATVRLDDNGPGLPPGMSGTEFEPFRSTRTGGMGLGLWISSEIVAEAGGRLRLLPRPEGGTRAEVVLERVLSPGSPDPSVGRQPPPNAVATPVGLRMLVVDDEPGIRRAIVAALRPLGTCVAHSSIEEAKVALRDPAGWDTVLADVMLTDGEGPDLIDWLRQENPALAVRSALMTGGAVGSLAVQRVEDAGVPVLAKPFGRQALIELVTELARRR